MKIPANAIATPCCSPLSTLRQSRQSHPLTWLFFLLSFLLMLGLNGCGSGSGGGSPISSLPSITLNDATALPEQTQVVLNVSLSKAANKDITFNYQTLDGSALVNIDYLVASGSVTIAAGLTSASLPAINLVANRDTTTTKMFHVTLSNPINATLSDDTAVITLASDNESALFSNPAYTVNWGVKGVFTNATQCASCHTGTSTIMNANGEDVSPVTQWQHSIMAHALNDPYFTAVVEEETHQFADKKVFIEDTCLRCHAPMAYTHAHQNIELLTPDPTGLLPNGGYAMSQAMIDPHAREGVACTACHQMQDQNLGTAASMSGHYSIKSLTENNGVDPTIFGPYTSPVGQAMQNNTLYTPQYAAHIHSSALCATCHNLYTPTLDLSGAPVMIDVGGTQTLSQFPEQAPYWEWLNSRYSDPANSEAKTCQACHMVPPEEGFTTAISTKPNNAPLRPSATDLATVATSQFSTHEMVGGNEYLLNLLKTYTTELGIADKTTSTGFDAKINQTKVLLQNSATLDIGTTTVANNILNVPLTITNLTGHKLPTSYPSRRMWVHFTVKDNTGATVFESGAVDANGRIAKDSKFTQSECLSVTKDDATFDYTTCYQPHQNLINDPNQVAIYESVLGDVNQDITHVLLHARQYLKDNRIPPMGWTQANRHPNPVDVNIYDDGIVGLAQADANFASGANTVNGADGKDTLTYQVNIASVALPLRIEARLLYQTIRPSFVDALHADQHIEGDSHVRRFKTMYAQTPPTPSVLATVEGAYTAAP
ncbi:hypothetical protein [Thiomicrorhabdus aquaedulcis]|uniref:hypothetical protein n=1 Tax=Thiomicrorhabdus aquaedulcis TaxID=2211106 RepID=UPI000FD82FF0|nr:hypothetical protein [Thiomicrorhabdus aquaedulcis]